MPVPFEEWASAPAAGLTVPTVSAQQAGFVCGAADPNVFNQLFKWLTAEATSANSRLEALEDNDLGDDATVASLIATVNQNGTDITALETLTNSNVGRLSALETEQSVQNTTLGNLSTSISNNDDDIADLESDVSAIQADVIALQNAPSLASGNRVLLLDQDLTGLSQVEFVSLMDPVLYEGYVIEIIAVEEGVSNGSSIHIRTSRDNGANFDEGASDYSVNVKESNITGPGDVGFSTSDRVRAYVGETFGASVYHDTTIKFMSPDLNIPTSFDVEWDSYGSGASSFRRIRATRNFASPVNAIQVSDFGSALSGHARMYGILR